jgi:hypothetical protein
MKSHEVKLIELMNKVITDYRLTNLYFAVSMINEEHGPDYEMGRLVQGNVVHIANGTEDFISVVFKALWQAADVFIAQYKDNKELVSFEVKYDSFLPKLDIVITNKTPNLTLRLV